MQWLNRSDAQVCHRRELIPGDGEGCAGAGLVVVTGIGLAAAGELVLAEVMADGRTSPDDGDGFGDGLPEIAREDTTAEAR